MNIRGFSSFRCVGRLLVVALSLTIMVTSSPVVADDFEEGLRAFRAGDNLQALEIWWPLARAGDANAQHAIGTMHEYGRGLDSDDVEAAKWYEMAADQNFPEAQYRLGVLHENGWGLPRDELLAAQWYSRAAQLGHVFAQHDLAYMFLNGTAVSKDLVQAYMWLRIASTQRPDLMAKHLANVSRMMTPEERAEAERRAQAWLNSVKL